MSQGQASNNINPPPNCVRVWNIPKTLKLSVRHFDTILEAMRIRIGKIKFLMVWKVASGSAADNNTCAYIELHDDRRHFELVHALHGTRFHGNTLSAQMAYHRFNNLDDDYAPRTISCLECESFEERLCEWEEDFMQGALRDEKRRRAVAACTRPIPLNYFKTAGSQGDAQTGSEQKKAEAPSNEQTTSMLVEEKYWNGDDGS